MFIHVHRRVDRNLDNLSVGWEVGGGKFAFIIISLKTYQTVLICKERILYK